MVADIEELEKWTHLKSTQKRLNAKEVLMSTSGDNFLYPLADGTVNPLEEINFRKHPSQSRTGQTEKKNNLIFERIRQVFFHLHDKTHRKKMTSTSDVMPEKRIEDCWNVVADTLTSFNIERETIL